MLGYDVVYVILRGNRCWMYAYFDVKRLHFLSGETEQRFRTVYDEISDILTAMKKYIRVFAWCLPPTYMSFLFYSIIFKKQNVFYLCILCLKNLVFFLKYFLFFWTSFFSITQFTHCHENFKNEKCIVRVLCLINQSMVFCYR